MRIERYGLTALVMAGLALVAEPVLAHHPMGGATPETFMHGLLSGLGHPVIGPDHLAFIIAIGLAAALLPAGIALAAGFIVASLGGVVMHLMGINVPMSELLIAATLVVAGLAFLRGGTASRGLWIVFGCVAGLLHGYAYGESVIGAETGVIGAYLIGLSIVQFAIAAGVMALGQSMLDAARQPAAQLRVAGLALVGLGTYFSVGAVGFV